MRQALKQRLCYHRKRSSSKVENDRQRIAISFGRLKPGRSEPFLHVNCYLGLSRASQQTLTLDTGRSALSFLAGDVPDRTVPGYLRVRKNQF